jgi:hypothetical protein
MLGVAGAWVTPFGFLLPVALWVVALVQVVRRASPSRDAPATLGKKALLVELAGAGAFVASSTVANLSCGFPAVSPPRVLLWLVPFLIYVKLVYVSLVMTGLVMTMVAADRGERRRTLVKVVVVPVVAWLIALTEIPAWVGFLLMGGMP